MHPDVIALIVRKVIEAIREDMAEQEAKIVASHPTPITQKGGQAHEKD